MSFFDRWRRSSRTDLVPRTASEAAENERVSAAKARGQRVVFTDWVGVWTITDAGAAFFAERLDLVDQIPVTDARDTNMARWQAAERYPELSHLRPVRQAGDYDCPSCGGTGQLRLPPGTKGNVWCSCGGVGWLPYGYVDPHGSEK